MGNNLIHLVILLCAIIPIAHSSIVLPNYNSNPIGERAGLQGGAFLVRVNDVSATWYNPAGLVKAQRNSISGNASAFAIQEGKRDEKDEGSTLVPVPSMVGSEKSTSKFLSSCKVMISVPPET